MKYCVVYWTGLFFKRSNLVDWKQYCLAYKKAAQKKNIDSLKIKALLLYAKNLYDQNLPIVYDQKHLALLIGIDDEYLHRMSNAPEHFYRTFYIKKRNGKKRRIDEPLPDLKKVQQWILTEILYNIPCSKYAKAYIPKISLKSNVRFHRNQKIVVSMDIKNFFGTIRSGRILNLYLSLGFSLPIAVILTHLCCFNNCLPQGAPTSAYLSNLVMKKFDLIISEYTLNHDIRYTRYADDMTFSGDVNISALKKVVDQELQLLGLSRNIKKFKVMRQNDCQKVTGIVVNKKIQLPREYRQKIRQEIYYINKFGIESHLEKLKETRAHYLNYLKGKIQYCLFINPNDIQMKKYLHIMESIN
jgi:RNA-directed DNA polymerase